MFRNRDNPGTSDIEDQVEEHPCDQAALARSSSAVNEEFGGRPNQAREEHS